VLPEIEIQVKDRELLTFFKILGYSFSNLDYPFLLRFIFYDEEIKILIDNFIGFEEVEYNCRKKDILDFLEKNYHDFKYKFIVKEGEGLILMYLFSIIK
jgi:hypothetical protein